jgi:ABC-type lipoprotein export system ATPase subunit
MSLLTIEQLKFRYPSQSGDSASKAWTINIPSFQMSPGELTGLAGGSGLGKSTFLNLIAGLTRCDSGTIELAGQKIQELSESARDQFRAQNLGYVFQSFHLLDAFSVLENVLIGMKFSGVIDRTRATALLERVGLGQRLHHYPNQLSVGQRQRVAVARALANQPRLVLADEPTGNLDRKTGQEILQLLLETCRENQSGLLLVSHDPEVLGALSVQHDFEELNQTGMS